MSRHAARAMRAARRTRSRRPDADVNAMLAEGVERHRAGDAAAAERLYRSVLAAAPDQPDAIHFLGVLASQKGDHAEAARLLTRARRAQPRNADIHNNLGVAFSAQNAHAEAEAACRRATQLNPAHADAHYNLGIALAGQGRWREAVAANRAAIALQPDLAAAYNNLGNALRTLGRLQEAVDAYRRALELAPGYAEAHSNLGVALKDGQRFEPAVAAFRQAIAGNPNFAEAYSNMGTALLGQGMLAEARAACRKALELDPAYAQAHSNLMFCMACGPEFSGADILAEARRWDARHAVPRAAGARPYVNAPAPDRRLRIGYVSPDFRTHAVSYFLEPLIAAHDREAVEVVCYAEVPNSDETTDRYQALADVWRPTVGLSDREVAETVRKDGIDILVDLAGHTAGNRLLAFAERPAPVAMSHLVGYGQTTGMSAIDYAVADDDLCPAATARYLSETPCRLERCFVSFQPRPDWPEVTPSPAASAGHVTFVSLNSPSRITPAVVAAWSTLLERVEGSRLLLAHGFFRDDAIRARFRDAFGSYGVGARVAFDAVERGWPQGMDLYQGVDIALDTFPMASATSTCIALWMGVPVVSLAGEAVHSRFGASLLRAAGFAEGVTANEADYLAKAEALAGDVERLATLRAGMREDMAASPLLDHSGLARAIETAYRSAWVAWCRHVDPRGATGSDR